MTRDPRGRPRLRPSLYRPLTVLDSREDYRRHYEQTYCSSPVTTFDDIRVFFFPEAFDHAFFGGPGKQHFSLSRAQRIDWIGEVLRDSDAAIFVGWDNKRKRHDRSRRVAVVEGDYVVVIRFRSRGASFVTAFVADPHVGPIIRTCSLPW